MLSFKRLLDSLLNILDKHPIYQIRLPFGITGVSGAVKYLMDM